MGVLVLHELGGVSVEGVDLLVRAVPRIGAFGGHEGYEERVPLTDIEEVVIKDGRHPDIGFRTADHMLGLHLRHQSVKGPDGAVYSPARRLAEEITGGNPAVRSQRGGEARRPRRDLARGWQEGRVLEELGQLR